jgi:uncharacterized membrane protein
MIMFIHEFVWLVMCIILAYLIPSIVASFLVAWFRYPKHEPSYYIPRSEYSAQWGFVGVWLCMLYPLIFFLIIRTVFLFILKTRAIREKFSQKDIGEARAFLKLPFSSVFRDTVDNFENSLLMSGEKQW